MVVIWFTFVETQGLTLEEIAARFDGGEEFDSAVAMGGLDVKDMEGEIVRIEKTA